MENISYFEFYNIELVDWKAVVFLAVRKKMLD